MDRTQPLGLPQGSVRAVLTVLLTVAGSLAVVTGHEVPTSFLIVWEGALAWYFVSRATAPRPEPGLESPVGSADE